MNKIFSSFVAAALLFSLPAAGFAAEIGSDKPVRWEVRVGFGEQYTNNHRPNDFDMWMVLPSLAVPISRTGGGTPDFLEGRFEWAPELNLALFTHPYHRGLFGVTPLQFRYVFQPAWKIKPYFFGGVGVLYSNINRRETRSDWNFNPQGGGGVYYDFSDTASLILEYRHIHISNAGLHEDNAGINSHNVLLGVSFKK